MDTHNFHLITSDKSEIILRLDGGQRSRGYEEEADPVHLTWAVQQVPQTNHNHAHVYKSLKCYPAVIDIQTYQPTD